MKQKSKIKTKIAFVMAFVLYPYKMQKLMANLFLRAEGGKSSLLYYLPPHVTAYRLPRLQGEKTSVGRQPVIDLLRD